MLARLVIDDLALERGERRLFDRLSFELAAGEAVALTGDNGAGKTSLLRAVAGLLRPAAGEITFHTAGESMDSPMDPDEARTTALHFIGHQDGLKGARTAGEELDFWAAWAGGDAGGQLNAVKTLGLAPLLALEVRKLSAGQRRRLALARLIAAPRPLWLLDEPLAPLDAARRLLIGEVMAAHLSQGGMILAAVHDPLPIPSREVRLGQAAHRMAA